MSKKQSKSSSGINQPKIDKILFVESLNEYYYPYQNWYAPLKSLCKNIISFDNRWHMFRYGEKKMNKMFLDLVKKEKPDFIMMWIRSGEFFLDTLLKIKEISPKSMTTMFFGDDDVEFKNFSRYMALFLDYKFIGQKKFIEDYKKEGIKNTFFTLGIDGNFLKPLDVEKKHDVIFIGSPKLGNERYNILKFLKDNNVNLKIFGWGWDKYPDLKDIYLGPLDNSEMIKVINQGKINLNLTKNKYGKPQLKGKFLEGASSKTFVLTEYCKDYEELFKEGTEMISFKDNQDLLNKINFYLKYPKERNKVTSAAYKKMMEKYTLGIELAEFFKKNFGKNKKQTHNTPPKINKKIIALKEKDLNLDIEKLRERLTDCDYVYFNYGKAKNLAYREYLQAYSLEKSKKQISCCDYYVSKGMLKNYLFFRSKRAFMTCNIKDFVSFLSLSQLMITKDYLLENLDKFKFAFKGSKIGFLNDKNTVFVSFPLIELRKIKTKNYEIMKKAFDFKFLYTLYSLKYHKKFLSPYLWRMLLAITLGDYFILKAIIKTINSKDKQNKLKSFEVSNKHAK